MKIFAKSMADTKGMWPDDIKLSGPNGKPIIIDAAIANQSFTPHLYENGKKAKARALKFTKESFENILAKGVIGRPLYVSQNYGGHEDKKPVGSVICGKVIEEGDKVILRLFGNIWDEDFKKEDYEITALNQYLGASVELDKPVINEEIVTDSGFTGVVIMDKNVAALRNTEIYCSDADASALRESSQLSSKVKNAQLGGKKMSEKQSSLLLAGLPPEHLKLVEDYFVDAKKQWETDWVKKHEIEENKIKLQAATDALKESETKYTTLLAEKDNIAKELDTTKKALEEKNNVLAALETDKKVEEQFTKIKAGYADENHATIREILKKTIEGKTTPEDVIKISELKIQAKAAKLTPSSSGTTPSDKTEEEKRNEATLEKSKKFLDTFFQPQGSAFKEGRV